MVTLASGRLTQPGVDGIKFPDGTTQTTASSPGATKASMFATVSNVTGSRAFGTVYQNTSGTPMFVNAMIEEAGQGDYSLDIGRKSTNYRNTA